MADEAQLHIRLTKREHEAIKQAAKKSGQTMTNFVKSTSVRVADSLVSKDKKAEGEKAKDD